jgi:hypothetical protein
LRFIDSDFFISDLQNHTAHHFKTNDLKKNFGQLALSEAIGVIFYKITTYMKLYGIA